MCISQFSNPEILSLAMLYNNSQEGTLPPRVPAWDAGEVARELAPDFPADFPLPEESRPGIYSVYRAAEELCSHRESKK